RGARPVRVHPGPGDRPRGHCDDSIAVADLDTMSAALRPSVLELGLGALLLLVFFANLLQRGDDRRWLAWLATGGVPVLGLASFAVAAGPPALGGMLVQDGLAIFAKRLFLVATFIGLLAGLSGPGPTLARRAGEYHLLLLSSLLGMLVLVSARDIILLFL